MKEITTIEIRKADGSLVKRMSAVLEENENVGWAGGYQEINPASGETNFDTMSKDEQWDALLNHIAEYRGAGVHLNSA